MTIVLSVLLVTAVWTFLVAVLGGCGSKDNDAARHADNVFGGEFWRWERRDGGVRLRTEAAVAGRTPATRSEPPVVPSAPA